MAEIIEMHGKCPGRFVWGKSHASDASMEFENAVKRLPANDANRREWVKTRTECDAHQ